MFGEIREFHQVKSRPIRIQFVGGLDPTEMLKEVLWPVSGMFDFVIDDIAPEFVVFGPYAPPPPRRKNVRVGYYCENIWPNLEVCDWAFGIPYEEQIGSDRYCRIEWHGIRPQELAKDIPAALTRPIPQRFCNFVFSNCVGFREDFFRALCQYKHVDAPGHSMNNQPSLDSEFQDESRWIRKRKFLSQYKFT